MSTPTSPRTDRPASYARLAVVGAGAWGTALAIIAAGNAAKVLLWAREREVVEAIATTRQNKTFLAGIVIPAAVEPSLDMARVAEADAVLLVAPAQHTRSVLEEMKPHLTRGTPVVLCAKGIETGSGLLLSETLAGILPEVEPAILSGPSFARDVARGLPTAVTIAARPAIAARLQASLSRPGFRPYASEDVIGVALGGAAKNVYAIACGMVEGAGMGESARAATISRGFAELMRLGTALGGRAETLIGLSGLGDLVLTATCMSSRNFSLGVALGRGARLGEISGTGHPLAEGAATAPALVARARRHGVELPIAEGVAAVLEGRLGVRDAAEILLSRPLKPE